MDTKLYCYSVVSDQRQKPRGLGRVLDGRWLKEGILPTPTSLRKAWQNDKAAKAHTVHSLYGLWGLVGLCS